MNLSVDDNRLQLIRERSRFAHRDRHRLGHGRGLGHAAPCSPRGDQGHGRRGDADHSDDPEEWASIEERAGWYCSLSFEQGKWHRVRELIRKRLLAGDLPPAA